MNHMKNLIRLILAVLAVGFVFSNKAYASSPKDNTKPVEVQDYNQHVLDYYDSLLREWGWDISDEDQMPECSEDDGNRCG